MKVREVINVKELEYLRQEINKIDESLVCLFKKRMEIVYKVVKYKIKNSMEVFDRTREEEIISKHLSNIEDKALKNSLKEFLEDLMKISRKAQKEIIYENISLNKLENKN